MLKSTFVRYFIIGITGALLDFAGFALFYKVFRFGEVLSNILSSFIGFNNNFFLNAFFNFKTTGNLPLRYLSYFVVCLFGMVISSTFLYVTVSIMGFNAFLCKFIAMSFMFVIQYFLNKKITFRKVS